MRTRYQIRFGRGPAAGTISVFRIEEGSNGPRVSAVWHSPDWPSAISQVDRMIRDPKHDPTRAGKTTWRINNVVWTWTPNPEA